MDGIICRDIAIPSYFNWSPHGWRRVFQIVAVVIGVGVGVGVGIGVVVGGVVGGGVSVRCVVHHKHIGDNVRCRAGDLVPRANIPFIGRNSISNGHCGVSVGVGVAIVGQDLVSFC